MAKRENTSGQESPARFVRENDSAAEARAPVWALGFQRIFGIDDTGTLSMDSQPYQTDRLLVKPGRRIEGTTELSLSAHQQLELEPGAMIVLGVANSGKTLLSRTLSARNEGVGVATIRYREPEPDSLIYEAEAVRALHEVLDDSRTRFIFVDSLRTVFYTSGGATGKGGVNMGIFELLTAYDVLARRLGKVIAFALNPMTTDEQALDFYLEAARGSVTYTVHAVAPKKFRLSSRTARSRDWVNLSYEPSQTDSRRASEPQLVLEDENPSDESILDLYNFTSR